MANIVNVGNQTINTTQPTPLRGLVLRGVRTTNEINCRKVVDGKEYFLKCREEDYDKDLHGEKLDKLPTRSSKKKAKKKAKAEADDKTTEPATLGSAE